MHPSLFYIKINDNGFPCGRERHGRGGVGVHRRAAGDGALRRAGRRGRGGRQLPAGRPAEPAGGTALPSVLITYLTRLALTRLYERKDKDNI